jgi:effector-binding domain-containing protein
VEHEVHVVERPALRVVAKRLPVALESIGPTLAQAFGEVYAAIGAARAEAAGPPFVIYHSMPVPGQPLDMEVCAPVAGPLEPPAPWHLIELPAGTFASRMHVGPYDTIGATYEQLSAWIPEHGYAFAGPPREAYLSEPSTPPEQTQTIVEFPVTRVPVSVR